MRPSYWGKYFWKVIHITALGYPETPDQNDRDTYRKFFETIGKVLPCQRCSNNYAKHMETLPIESFLDSSENLFKWTVFLHNIVSKELGKPQWNVEYASSFYTAEEQRSFQLDQPHLFTGTDNQKAKEDDDDRGQKSNDGQSSKRSFSVLSIFLMFLNILFAILIAIYLWKKLKP